MSGKTRLVNTWHAIYFNKKTQKSLPLVFRRLLNSENDYCPTRNTALPNISLPLCQKALNKGLSAM